MAPKSKPAENYGLSALQLDVKHLEEGRGRKSRTPAEPEKEFGVRLARVRESRELSQEQLSQMTKAHDAAGEGISRAVVSMYERGRNRPSTRELRILCDTLTITPSELLYGDSAPFDIDRWQVIDRRGGDARYFARWLYLFAGIDSTMQVAIYELVLGITRPTQKQLSSLDADSKELFLRLADEFKDPPKGKPPKV